MSTLLQKSVFLFTSDVYLEIFPLGDSLPVDATVRFPLDTRRQSAFQFNIGLMTGHVPEEGDFEELGEIYVDALPKVPGGLLDLGVTLIIDDQKSLGVQVNFFTPNGDAPLAEGQYYGPVELPGA